MGLILWNKMAKSVGFVIGILLLIIVVLIGFLVYAFAIRPAITGYMAEKQFEGFEYALVSIMQQAATCQPVPLTYNNQTINMIWVECLQQAQQQAQSQQLLE